jgi:Ca2+-binding RTX toxin-like protein
VVAFGGQNTVTAGSGGVVSAVQGPSNTTVFGAATGAAPTLFGGAGATVTYSSSLEGATMYSGTGNETLSAAPSSVIGNVIWGGSDTSGADSLVAGSGNDTLLAGRGSTTMVGGTGDDQFAFVKGFINGAANVTVTGFNTTNDQAFLYNYGAGEAASVLASQSNVGGNTTITLSDGTHIEFQGVADLTSKNLFSTT